MQGKFSLPRFISTILSFPRRSVRPLPLLPVEVAAAQLPTTALQPVIFDDVLRAMGCDL